MGVADLGFLLAASNLIALCGWLGPWIAWQAMERVGGETAELRRARGESSQSFLVLVPIAISIVLSLVIFGMVIANDGTG